MKLHPLQIAAYIIIVIAGMKLAAPIVNLILLALLLTGSIMPVIIWLIKKRVPKAIAIITSVLLLIFITMMIGSVVSVAVVGIAEKVPQYEVQLNTLTNNAIQFFAAMGIDLSDISSIEELSPGNL